MSIAWLRATKTAEFKHRALKRGFTLAICECDVHRQDCLFYIKYLLFIFKHLVFAYFSSSLFCVTGTWYVNFSSVSRIDVRGTQVPNFIFALIKIKVGYCSLHTLEFYSIVHMRACIIRRYLNKTKSVAWIVI